MSLAVLRTQGLFAEAANLILKEPTLVKFAHPRA